MDAQQKELAALFSSALQALAKNDDVLSALAGAVNFNKQTLDVGAFADGLRLAQKSVEVELTNNKPSSIVKTEPADNVEEPVAPEPAKPRKYIVYKGRKIYGRDIADVPDGAW